MFFPAKDVRWVSPSLTFLIFVILSGTTSAQNSEGKFNQSEFVMDRARFASSLREIDLGFAIDNVPDNGGVVNASGFDAASVIRDPADPTTPADFAQVIYRTTIEAGSATGSPPASPASRVDPNGASGLYPGVGSLELVHPTLGTFTCSGSVIDDEFVLTAAHCFDLDNDGSVDAGITTSSMFHLNHMPTTVGTPSSSHGISNVTIHPDFGGFTATGANDDLGVVKLSSAVPSITPKYALRNTGISSGEALTLVGYGVSGFGDVAGVEVIPDYTVKRAGANEADLFVVDDDLPSMVNEIFIYDFDGPIGTGSFGGTTLGNDVETMVRGGDSGGPALVTESGALVLAGVNTFEFELMGITPPVGTFGAIGGGIILNSDYVSWITSIAPGSSVVPEPSSLALLFWSSIFLLWRRRR